MNDLDRVKTYLRIDEDIKSEDKLLEDLINASKLYISRTTGKKYIEKDFVMQMLVNLLVSHWYTNRNAMNGKTNVEEFSHSITAILTHIAVTPVYEAES